jgi:hypothetical protein
MWSFAVYLMYSNIRCFRVLNRLSITLFITDFCLSILTTQAAFFTSVLTQVFSICSPYIDRSTFTTALRVIHSSDNLYCMPRLAMPAIMRSDQRLICDDDVIPVSSFVEFFMDACRSHPMDILCLRGHCFKAHYLNEDDPREAWDSYSGVRFVDDSAPECSVHFAHFDAAMVSRSTLGLVASIPMPDRRFILVNDYWICFVANWMFDVPITKLAAPSVSSPSSLTSAYMDSNATICRRMDDSDTPGLALHARSEVQEARVACYIYHMMRNWPEFDTVSGPVRISPPQISKDSSVLSTPHVGFNISSRITNESLLVLRQLGVRHVRTQLSMDLVSLQHPRDGLTELNRLRDL